MLVGTHAAIERRYKPCIHQPIVDVLLYPPPRLLFPALSLGVVGCGVVSCACGVCGVCLRFTTRSSARQWSTACLLPPVGEWASTASPCSSPTRWTFVAAATTVVASLLVLFFVLVLVVSLLLSLLLFQHSCYWWWWWVWWSSCFC